MARLTAAQRRGLKAGQFAGKNRSYPVNDRTHAVDAKARAKQALDAGRISRAEFDRIVARANAVLGRTGKSLKEKLS